SDAPHRGQASSSAGPAERRGSSGCVVAVMDEEPDYPWTCGSGSDSYCAALSTVGVPQCAQNAASAGRGEPHCEHVTTGASPTARPQLAQKCEAYTIGAPQTQGVDPTGARRASAAWASMASTSWRRRSTPISS